MVISSEEYGKASGKFFLGVLHCWLLKYELLMASINEDHKYFGAVAPLICLL